MRHTALPSEPVVWRPGVPNEKQRQFLLSRAMYTAYGGAKGGGKTWAVRVKAIGGALCNPGLRVLIMRRTYPELEENHIRPILRELPPQCADYNGTSHLLRFLNGSTIKFGHWQEGASEREYQGLEYDWIFIDEATQFTEEAFRYLGGCLRGTSRWDKRMYLTCNPGGVGHQWVKRLFIDRVYRTGAAAEECERAEDYVFIPATVEDNTALLRSSPGYLRMLSSMPENLRRAFRYGDWDAIGGGYFPEFSRSVHSVPPFPVPAHWQRLRSFDYGLDRFHCLWWAVDEDGRLWCTREYARSELVAGDAAKEMLALSPEPGAVTYAPPDLWARQKDTGRSVAEIFLLRGVSLVRSGNERVQGHLLIKEALQEIPVGDPFVKKLLPGRERLPALMFFHTCRETMECLETIQSDENDPNDCATVPHNLTHAVDAVRYCVTARLGRSEKPPERLRPEAEGPEWDAQWFV